jgi:8-oxo-dGTP pyrophosphatase MutT (NUDIX family)
VLQKIATEMQKNNYRKCAAVFLLKPGCWSDALVISERKSGNETDFSAIKVFVGERCDVPSAWQIPQGGVEEEETHLCAAMRELKEETGVTHIKLLKNTNNLYRYDFPKHVMEQKKCCFHENFIGQEIRFFLFEFLGNDSEISVDNVQYQEFSRWQWMRIDRLMKEIVDFKQQAYMAAAVELGIL